MSKLLDEFQSLLDNTEPCAVDLDADGQPNDPDKWVGSWAESTDPEVADALCAGCHVKEQCLAYALAANERHHIWGGTTGTQRKETLREQKKNGSTS
jgi:hypothetical protein